VLTFVDRISEIPAWINSYLGYIMIKFTLFKK